jgi:NAD(P)-dependent dehydrogenase (short-subunit alcohol dehydrogenase family)
MPETILITGTSRGLGHGLARAFLEKGDRVYGCSRGSSDLGDDFPDSYHHFTIDLSDPVAGDDALRKAIGNIERFARVILNAGILPEIRDMQDTPLDVLRETMEINVWSNKWILDRLLDMPAKPGQVVAISSGAAVSGSRGWNGYSISKAALNMLIKLYAEEEPEVHFTSLAPGLVETAMQDYIGSIEDDADFSTIQRLKAARNTPDMPGPDAVGEHIRDLMNPLMDRESGSFLDIRGLNDQ